MKRGRLVILLVEDDENDAFFVKRATEDGGAEHEVHSVQDGEEAIRYLKGQGKFAARQKYPFPNVVLTDLKMAGMDGFEFLRWMREQGDCRVIPVIVYSNSHQESDVRQAYELGANSYIRKPHSLSEMVELLRAMYEYWSRCESPSILNNC